jgi:hypothetical protein
MRVDGFVEDDRLEQMDPDQLAAIRDRILQRCRAANLETKEDNEDKDYLVVAMPCGRDTRWITLVDSDDLQVFESLPFEKYSFLSDYNAICSYETDEIEAGIRSLASNSVQLVYRRLFPHSVKEGQISEEELSLCLLPEPGSDAPEIAIGSASEKFKKFCQLQVLPSSQQLMSLRILRARISQHDQAVSLLEKISNSLFFQIDLLLDMPLGLARTRRRLLTGRRKIQKLESELQYPRHEYDEAPASLYWYAKSAITMPLLQFLAYYQCIEYYFPTYSQAEAHRKIRAILRDPAFRSDRDTDLARIVAAIQATRAGNMGDERSQLRATLSACVDADDLRTFLEADEGRKGFLSSKTKGLTDQKLQIADQRLDLRNEVADRIYDIRCKIVHTKSDTRDGEIALLLPFSKEAEQLYYDISLIEFLARKILISASTPLKLQ